MNFRGKEQRFKIYCTNLKLEVWTLGLDVHLSTVGSLPKHTDVVGLPSTTLALRSLRRSLPSPKTKPRMGGKRPLIGGGGHGPDPVRDSWRIPTTGVGDGPAKTTTVPCPVRVWQVNKSLLKNKTLLTNNRTPTFFIMSLQDTSIGGRRGLPWQNVLTSCHGFGRQL